MTTWTSLVLMDILLFIERESEMSTPKLPYPAQFR